MNGHKKGGACGENGVSVVSPPAPKPLFEMNMQKFGTLTVSLPFVGLVVCFVSAVIFQYDLVSRTETCSTPGPCFNAALNDDVPNMVPSISAVTGVSPQRYFWRVCIALHCAPRFVIGYMYWSYYMERLQHINLSAGSRAESVYRALASTIFYVYTIENACLVGITYISNVENYPIHEKLFIVFMITSLLHELLTIIIFRWSHPNMHHNPLIAGSFRIKVICFVSIMSCTAGLLYFYFLHRWYCQPGSFTMFSTFEYAIGFINMYFHYTAVREFGHCRWTFSPVTSTTPAPPTARTTKTTPRDVVGSVLNNTHNNSNHNKSH